MRMNTKDFKIRTIFFIFLVLWSGYAKSYAIYKGVDSVFYGRRRRARLYFAARSFNFNEH